jgi:hypothetical protein
MTRSIQLQGVKRAVGGIVQTKERLSQESLNSRTREYMLVKRLGQLFFERPCVGIPRMAYENKVALRDNGEPRFFFAPCAFRSTLPPVSS